MAQHLIHIGYPKAGSTFLQAWFERHPKLCYVPGGLGGFYDVYEIARAPDVACKYYVTSYEGLSTPSKSAGGINLTYGGAAPDADIRTRESQSSVCSVLKSLYPGSRVIIVTRGFKAMIVSSYSQYVRMGGTLHLNAMCRQLEGLLQNDSMQYFDFDSLIRMYGEAFGESNLIVLPYELLRDDQDKFLAVLEEKLDLEHVEIKLGRVNPSLSPEELYWYPVISRAVSATASRLGSAPFRRIYGWYIGKTLNNKLRPFIKTLQRLRPDRKISEADFPADILRYCEGKATRLRDHPLYAPYVAEYLLADEHAGA
jgi:hypothetical protein